MYRILYLHGFASSPASSKARFLGDRLARAGFAVEIPCLAPDFEHLTITGQLQVIAQAAADEPVSLIGSSMGGYLAALYAARHPEVSRVAAMAPAFGFARRWPERLGATALEEWKRTGWLEVFHYGEARTRKVSYALLEDGARYEDDPEVTQPCLIYHGIHDDVVPMQFSQDFAAGRRNVRLEIKVGTVCVRSASTGSVRVAAGNCCPCRDPSFVMPQRGTRCASLAIGAS